mmetsp:Transcript_6685/g.25053  ORF Transcript_6685/g.25053 Transcript_6685/m.25053 type:complete len:96 (-) Transcript_6685:834-1121(-)
MTEQHSGQCSQNFHNNSTLDTNRLTSISSKPTQYHAIFVSRYLCNSLSQHPQYLYNPKVIRVMNQLCRYNQKKSIPFPLNCIRLPSTRALWNHLL